MSRVEAFFRDLDRCWTVPLEGPITLRLVGSTALMLQTDYVRGTKDGDVLETPEIHGDVGAALLDLGGPGTALARRHGMYVELLGAAFPFLPDAPCWHCVTSFDPPLTQFRVEVLDVVDVSVAKLARFHRADQEDIAAMVERGLVSPGALLDRFLSAVGRWSMDARAEDLPRIVRNFHRVQRDVLFVDQAEVELPAWIADD